MNGVMFLIHCMFCVIVENEQLEEEPSQQFEEEPQYLAEEGKWFPPLHILFGTYTNIMIIKVYFCTCIALN